MSAYRSCRLAYISIRKNVHCTKKCALQKKQKRALREEQEKKKRASKYAETMLAFQSGSMNCSDLPHFILYQSFFTLMPVLLFLLLG
jgi:hypothetical protein